MNKAVYVGSFDPFTNGHFSIVKEASNVFDYLYVCIAINSNKKRTFDRSLMQSAMIECFKREKLNNIKVVCYSGLTADFCMENDVNYLVRGLRNTTDYMYEEEIAKVNHEFNPILKTVYFRAENDVVSSSMVRELLKFNKDVSKYVSPEILTVIKKTI